jgi:hypothetical protein
LRATENGCSLQSSDMYWTSHSITQHICNIYFIIYYTASRSLKKICFHSQMLNLKKLEIQNKELLLGFVFLCLFLYTYLPIFLLLKSWMCHYSNHRIQLSHIFIQQNNFSSCALHAVCKITLTLSVHVPWYVPNSCFNVTFITFFFFFF